MLIYTYTREGEREGSVVWRKGDLVLVKLSYAVQLPVHAEVVMHTYTHRFIYSYIYTYIYIYIYIYTFMHTNTHVLMYTYIYISTLSRRSSLE